MILHLYFARRFAVSLGLVMLALTAILGLFEFVDRTRKFKALDVSIAQKLELTVLSLPQAINQFLPMITMLATIVMFLGLARSSELVVARAAGRSALRILLAPLAVIVIVGCVAVTMLGPIAATTSKHTAALAQNYRAGGTSTLALSGDSLWLREGGPNGQTVIRAVRSRANTSDFVDATFVVFDPQGIPVRRINAAHVTLQDNTWVMTNAKTWPLVAGINPEAEAVYHDRLVLASTLTIDRIEEMLGNPSDISIWNMQNFIVRLEEAGFSARRHRVWLASELARPIFLAGMVLIAAVFCLRHARIGGAGNAVLFALLSGFAIYFIRRLALVLGENGQIPIMLAAWAAPLAAILLALGLLLHAEDG